MNRKKFLSTLTIGTVGLIALPDLLNAGAAKKLGLQLYSVREAVAKDLEGTLTRLNSMGYDFLEIYGYDGKFFGKTAAEFSAILKKTGMKVVSSHHTSGIAKNSAGTLGNGWQQAVEDLHTIGAEYMGLSYLFPDERTADTYAKLPDLMNKSAEVTKAAGIQFIYHNHDFEFEPYQDTLVYDYLINSTNNDLVKMELDLYWITKAGKDPVAYFNKYPGRFPLWHVKDMEAGTKDITEVGNGTVNFDAIFAAREKAGMKYWFVEQDVSKGDMFKSLEKSQKYLSGKNY